MTYDVMGGAPRAIDFGATGVEEVLQNVAMILTTPIFSVPLDRDFGVDFSLLDNPIPMAEAKLTSQIFQAIRAYEPRAMVHEISFLHSAPDVMDGKMAPKVTLEVDLQA